MLRAALARRNQSRSWAGRAAARGRIPARSVHPADLMTIPGAHLTANAPVLSATTQGTGEGKAKILQASCL